MASDSRIRASDADRDRTAALLREHHAAGRLSIDEFNERLDRAYAAKTLGDLDELLADLPGIDLYKLPDERVQRPRRGSAGGIPPLPWLVAPGSGDRLGPALRAGLGGLAGIAALGLVIWLATRHQGHLWWLWLLPWGVAVLGRRLMGGGSRRDHRRGRRRGW